MSESPTKSPFPAGFERDVKTLMLAAQEKLISKSEFRRIVGEMYDLDRFWDSDEQRALPAPQLVRPSLTDEFVPQFDGFEDDPDHVYETTTGAVFNVHTGEQVGWVELGEIALPEEGPEVVTINSPMVPEPEDAPIGPPPEGIEFIDPDGETDGVALPRPNPDEDEQIDDAVTPE